MIETKLFERSKLNEANAVLFENDPKLYRRHICGLMKEIQDRQWLRNLKKPEGDPYVTPKLFVQDLRSMGYLNRVELSVLLDQINDLTLYTPSYVTKTLIIESFGMNAWFLMTFLHSDKMGPGSMTAFEALRRSNPKLNKMDVEKAFNGLIRHCRTFAESCYEVLVEFESERVFRIK